MKYFKKLIWASLFSGMILSFGTVTWANKPPTVSCSDPNFQSVSATLVAGSTDERGKIDVAGVARSCSVTFGRLTGDIVCVALSDATALAGNQVSDNSFAFVTSAVSGAQFVTMTYMCSEL